MSSDHAPKNQAALDALKQELLLRKLKKSAAKPATPAARPQPVDRNRPLPLSLSQQRLWFLEQLGTGGRSYHLPLAIRLRGHVDQQALQAAFDALLLRHESLRTSIRNEAGAGWLWIHAAASLALEKQTLQAGFVELTHDQQEAQIQNRLAQFIARPFDLVQGPLVRGLLLQLSDEDQLLCVVMHHLIGDGWSNGILIREFATLYATACRSEVQSGEPGTALGESGWTAAQLAQVLPDLPLQYADYAVWQRDQLDARRVQGLQDFWRRTLQGAPACLDLPLDHPRPAVAAIAGASLPWQLTPQLSQALRDLSRRLDVTLFMVLQAAWALVLSRLSGQDEVVIGTPVANRPYPELEPLIGFFVNTLALRVKIDLQKTVADYLAGIKANTLEAFTHQALPFEQVVECLQPERSLSHSPVFQVLFSLQNLPTSRLELPALQITSQNIKQTTTQFDLGLVLEDDGQHIQGELSYATTLFDASTVGRWLEHLRQVLTGFCNSPQQLLHEISLLNPEQKQIIAGFNGKRQQFTVTQTLAGQFEAQVRRNPTAPALSFNGTELSYLELNCRANRLAHHLHRQGVRPEMRIAVICERGPDMIIALLAILKAGAAYVPIDPGYPQERIQFLLADTQPAQILLDAAGAAALEAAGPLNAMPCQRLDAAEPDWGYASIEDLPARLTGVSPDNLAYIIHTSGSTGQPKGVMIEQRQVSRLFAATQAWFEFGPDDVWTLFHSYAFDFSVWEIFGALLHGGRLVIVPALTARSPESFYRLLLAEKVTVLNQTPSAFRQLIRAQALVEEQIGQTAHHLRLVIFGGEALEPATLRPWVARNGLDAPRLINMYGITETTVHVTCQSITATDVEAGGSPIGVAIPDLEIHLLDAHGQLVPIGAPGEIHVAGAGLARGYFERPQLTQERFIVHPFPTEPGARLYRSGDLARRRADGRLDYLGRNDQQVKIRGYRIELGEIETALQHLPNIAQAVVTAWQEPHSEAVLVAYLVARDDQSPPLTSAELRSQLAQHLPAHMLPSFCLYLPQLPLTAHGKLDKRRLPAPDEAGFAQDQASQRALYQPPQNELEAQIAAVWQAILPGRSDSPVSRDDNFFDLGGHSLLIMDMLARLREQDIITDVRSVFMAPTVATLAAQISATAASFKASSNEAADPVVSALSDSSVAYAAGMPRPAAAADCHSCSRIPPDCSHVTPDMLDLITLDAQSLDGLMQRIPGGIANVQDIYPLTPLQEGLLFHHLWALENRTADAYVLPMLLRLQSVAQRDAFMAALQAVMDRHDVLRTLIVWQGLPRPLQIVLRKVELPCVSFELADTADTEAELARRLQPACLSLPLDQAPLLRVQQTQMRQEKAEGNGAESGEDRPCLILHFHHIISDHHSLQLILTEIQALLAGQTLPPPIPYRQFVARLEKQDWNAAKKHFQQQLQAVDAPTIAFDLQGMQVDADHIHLAQLELEHGLSQQLRRLARHEHVSVAAVFHLAMGLLLAHGSGQDRVVFGSVLSGRLQALAGIERIPGLFINTLPLCLDLQTADVRAALQQTQQALLELLHFEQTPLALAQQQATGLPAGSALFAAVLNYRHAAQLDGSSALADIEVLASLERTNYPCTINVDDLGEEGGFQLEAQTAAGFPPERITAYLHTLLTELVHALIKQPERAVLSLSLLGTPERRQLLEDFNATRSDYPLEQTLTGLFEAQVKRSPQAVALRFEGSEISYQLLDQSADALARELRACGAAPEKRVAICCERSLDLVVGLLAILKSGAAYVPVDPEWPAERLRWLLEDLQPTLLLTQNHLQSRLPASSVPCLLLDGPRPATPEATAAAASVEAGTGLDASTATRATTAGPDHLAYIIYTSGSTGQPKGAMNEHRAIVNRLLWMQEAYGLKPTDRVLQKTPYTFDVSVWEFFWPLITGACLVMARPGGHREPDYLRQLIEDEGITTLHFVPSMLQAFLDASPTEAQPEIPDSPLRRIIVSGEELPVRLQNRCLQRWPQAGLYNLYGPTEAAVDVTHWTCRPDAQAQRVPLGRPISNLRIYVLDARQQPVPIGVIGEICIGGVGVGRGYYNRPELTRERFLHDPYGPHKNGRMYRTGDLGRWRSDGVLEYLGRNDFQVKIRGQRIELGEIEARLLEQARVREAVVVAQTDAHHDQRLVAYLTLQGDRLQDREARCQELRQALTLLLPSHMLPSAFVVLDALPLSANGKLDRRALPAPEFAATTHYAAPQTALEIQLAELWQELLHLDRVGRNDDFFALGGHSLIAMQLAARLSQMLGQSVAVRQVFDTPRLRDLAAALEASLKTGPLAAIPVLDALPDYLPLSYAQRRLWFLSQIGEAAKAYHIPAALRLKGELDISRLQQALDALLARHRPLSTTLIPVDAEPMQWPHEPAGFSLPVIPLSDESILAGALQDFALEAFNLETGPLLRARLYRLNAQEHVLAVVVHHIVADGWSLQLALQEILQGYLQQRLPALPISFLDYAVWQRKLIDGGGLDGQRQYWLDRLAGELPLLQLPTDHPRPAVQSFLGGQHSQTLPPALVRQVNQACQRWNLTPYMLLLAIYQVLLHRLSGQTDILIGTPLAGRDLPQTQNLIGFFVNTLVLRCDLAPDPDVLTHFQQLRTDCLAAYANQDYPFDLLVDQLHSRRDLARQAVFDTAFTLETASRQPLPQIPGLDLHAETIPLARAKFDLSATMQWPTDTHDEARLIFEYSLDLFEPATIARFAAYYLNLLTDALQHPGRRLSELQLISAAERKQLLGPRFAGRPQAHPVTETLASRFATLASRQPAATALSLAGQHLSYGALEAQANQLAHEIIARGVRPGQAIMLCFERGFAMPTAILAVLKAGACYVPIEPGLPAERLRYLIDDSGTRLVLSHGKSSQRLRTLLADEVAEKKAGQGGASLTRPAVLCVDEQASALQAQPQTAPACEISPADRAYIIYTSGSTGQPKGCELSHANVLRLFAACARAGKARERFHFGPEQVWTLFHSYAFDFSVWEIFGALLHGGRLVIVPQEITRSPSDFADLLAAEKVTLLSQTPSAFLRLLERAQVEADSGNGTGPGKAGKTDPEGKTEKHAWARHLTHVVFGGEALDYASLRPWFRHHLNPETRLINMYGITETTVHVTWRVVRQEDVETQGASSNVGRPLDDLAVYVLDAHLQPQPVGVTGELYVGGAGLAHGYLNRPELTAQRFMPHPFVAGERLYRSGDLARWTARGEIEYLGRIDHQVKIHGYRIELGEIEARLASHPDVTHAIVLAIKDTRTLNDRLVAWFVATEPLTASALRSHLGMSLPDYMIPHSFHQLAEMPLTINGKIDRSRLQADLAARPQLDVPYVMPETPLEVRLAEIWSDVLGVARIGLADNFFDLGGDSFSAYRLMTRISDDLGRDLPLESIFRQQNIAAMVQALENEAAATEETSLVQIQSGAPGRLPFFCAHQAGGDVLSFRALSEALGQDRPFYGLQSAGRLLGESQHHTLEEMCADYIRDIRRIQPHGPYLIGGHSMGGKVAFELARQLEAAGEIVGVLAILDSDIVNKNTSMLDSMMLLSETFRLNIQREELARLEPKMMMDYLLNAGKKRFARVLEIAYDMDLLPRGFRTRDAEMFLNRIATNIHVSDAYLAPAIQTPVTLYLATDHTENSYIIDTAAWKKVALGGLTIIDVPGNHLNLIQKPHVARLAADLAERIRKLENALELTA